MDPFFSIITCCFNSEKTIDQTFSSIRNQTFKNFELIVIDGGSTDNTLKIINDNRDIISNIVSEKDQGVYDGMNKGIRLSSGKVIGFLNSDDFYANERVLEDIHNVFRNQEIDIAYGDLIYVDREKTEKIIRTWKSGEINYDKLTEGWIPAHPSFYARKKVYNESGYFDLTYNLAADYECMLRILLKRKYRIQYLPKTLVTMRLGGITSKNLTNRILQNIEIIRAWKKNTRSKPRLLFLNRLIIKISQFYN